MEINDYISIDLGRTSMKIIIIGGNAAGLSAASAIRRAITASK
jgi:monoamine oxidase